MAGQNLTKNQREYFKQLVLESTLKQYTATQAVEYIRQKLGVPIGIESYNKLKGQIKKDIGKRIEILQKDRYAYISQYFESIDELKFGMKKLHEIIDKSEHNPGLQKGCISELKDLTISVTSLYELLPDLLSLQLQHNEAYTVPTVAEEPTESEDPSDPEAKF